MAVVTGIATGAVGGFILVVGGGAVFVVAAGIAVAGVYATQELTGVHVFTMEPSR